MKPDPCRFCRLFAVSLLAAAVVLGALLGLQLSLEPAHLHASGSRPVIVLLSALRALSPAANGSALVIALVLWAHPLTLPAFAQELPRISQRAAIVSLPGFLVAFLVSAAVCSGIHALASGTPASEFIAALPGISAISVGCGLLSALADAGLVLLLAWRFLGRIKASRVSLPAMLVLAWTVTFPLRVMLGLVLESLLPG